MRLGTALMLLVGAALLAQPAQAAPMTEAEFNQVMAGLQNDTVLQCLQRERREALSQDAQLDACIAAVTNIEDGLRRIDHPSPAVEGVYLFVDLAALNTFIYVIAQVDGGNPERVCKANGQQMTVARLINLSAFDQAIAAQMREAIDQAEQLERKCQG